MPPKTAQGKASRSKPFGHRSVDFSSIATFGALTGDYSAIHFDASAGVEAGYGGPIAHGLLTASWAIGALTLHAPERVGLGQPNAIQSRYSLRLKDVVRAGDIASMCYSIDDAADDDNARDTARSTRIRTLNQHGATTSESRLEIRCADSLSDFAPEDAPAPWECGRWVAGDEVDPMYAEDLIDHGPRGRSSGRTVTEGEITAFARHCGELNPLYLDDEFARKSVFGARAAPPMWTFCLAFSDFLRDLLSVPMPSKGFAGHLGDAWTLFEPIRVGDTLRTHHEPLDMKRSRSNPGMAIVRFGIQVVNQHDRVAQAGETVMLIPARTAA